MEDKNKMIDEVINVLSDDAEAMIQDNKLIFSFEDKIYRVRMPSQKEKKLAQQAKNREYWRLVQEGMCPFEKDLIKTLKENEKVDIENMQKELDDLAEEQIQTSLSLSTKRDSEQEAIDKLIGKINEIKLKRRFISYQKADKLSASIESQIIDVFYEMLTSFCTERLINEKEDKWERVWNSFEDFNNDSSKLPYLAGGNFCKLYYRVL